MRKTGETLSESAAGFAGVMIGGFLGAWAIKGLFEGGKLLAGAVVELNQLRVTNPDEFDAQIVRAYNYDTPEAQKAWDNFKGWLMPHERERIEAKLQTARAWNRLLSQSPQIAATVAPVARRPVGRKKVSRRRRVVRGPFALAAPVARQLPAAPVAELPAAPVEVPKAAKKTKRGGKHGRMKQAVKLHLAAYARFRVERGQSHRAAIKAAAAERAQAEEVDATVMLRRVREAVRERFGDGQDVRQLRRFLGGTF